VTTLEFRLPDVGEGIANGEIIAWQVAVGDHVTEHQDLVEIQTDKATVVIPCPATGVITGLTGEEGDTIDVGSVLAVIEVAEAEAAADGASPAAGSGEPAAGGDPAVDGDPAVGAARTLPRRQLPLAAPTTRRLARELGVRLEGVEGSGPHGRILREDVERAAGEATAPAAPERDGAAAAPARDGAVAAPARDAADAAPAAPPARKAPAPGDVIALRGIRRTIAHTLTRAWLEVPRIVDYREVDATALLRARESLRRRALGRGDEALAKALTPTPFVVRAAVLAAREHPYVNASIDLEREEITLHRHYNVGIAAAGPDGLTVPVVHDADQRSLAEIALQIVELAHAARDRRLRPDQLAGPTLTVNNFGALGTWMGTPIVRPPEVANIGVGAIRDQVVAVDGAPVVRPTMVLSTAGDHRVLDGDTLAAFVTTLARLLEDPILLFEDLR
jgi:pyruvate/2-oxoglutarate dehydrogenase complex dihydrolipoamide acyltransferase (E2) component